MAQTVLCPYCFEEWRTHSAVFRCMSEDDSRCARVPDEHVARHRGITTPDLPRVRKLKGRLGREWRPKKGQRVRCECGAPMKRVCPSCHTDLPLRFADAPSRSMALIGTKRAGKTHFIAVTLQELEHRVGHRFGGSFLLLDDHTQQRVDREFRPRLYGTGAVLEPTQSARGDTSTSEPLVSRLTLGRDRAAVSSNLVFFDAAGEDLGSLDLLEREARYVTMSHGLILLVDPLQIPAVRDELEGVVELPQEIYDPLAMLGRVAGLIRESRGIPTGEKISVPLALTISKIDAMRPLLGDQHAVYSQAHHDGHYDQGAASSISAALRSDLAAQIGPAFDSLAQQEFETVGYFGVSALGEAPVDDRLRNGVSPHRVEDPILWMLNEWGALPRK